MPKSLIEKALKALPAKTPENQKKLLRELGIHIPSEDIEHFDVDLFLDMVYSHWRLATNREKGEPKIRIYCPISKERKARKTVIDIVSDDMAFLVDSVVAEINKSSLLIDFLIHPLIYANYSKEGKLTALSGKPKDGYIRQSHIHIHIKETVSDETMADLEQGLRTALDDVKSANRDWRFMLERLKEAQNELACAKIRIPAKEVEQYCAFLDYLHDNNFTLLGFREYEFVERNGELKSKTIRGKSLGLLANDVKPAYINEKEEGLPRNLQELRRDLPPVSVSKTNRLSTVHRRVPMDAIAVKAYDENGEVKGEKLFLGLFTSVTYSRSVSDVPFLREKVDEVIEMSNFLPQSHDRKALGHILEKYPRDELFQIPKRDLLNICLSILRLQERQHIALFMRRDPFGRYISCLVYIPRDRFGTVLRQKMGAILEQELNGKLSNFYTSLDDSVFARVMFMINVDQKKQPKFNPEHIERLLQEAGKTWAEHLSDAYADMYDDEQRITHLTLKYGEAFPSSYMTRYRPKQAIFDIEKIEVVLGDGRLELDLYHPEGLDPDQLRLKIYNPGKPLNLSDVLPILEHMGLRAISELPFEIKPEGCEEPIWVHDFLVETPDTNSGISIKDVKDNFETAFFRICYNEMESDGLNALILNAKMNGREVNILRSYVRYLKQIVYPFGRLYVERTLNKHPKISRLLVDLFKAYHDPQNGKNADNKAAEHHQKIIKALEKVDSLDEDRILRSITSLVEATLRTNYFQPDEDGNPKSYLALKLDSEAIPDLPEPKPYRETFVYSPRVEAIHLRGDKIARGGIRWSDRHEDFRTEVLGLMKSQMVKNAVIVPMGAKGGFVVKTPTKSREEFQAEGIECYKILMRGLLDLADNRKGDKVIPPKDIVRRDGDDPYLVVAADKGTATFSDIANGLSQEYGFWLDDAFASGGSAGYDHKEMGITARGAWESVKLHFRQLNHDTQKQPFDVIGVGDMGGDVFGNGMLLSEHIKLVGAFNHLHIFCDPDPDTESSYKERKRLFKAVKGWDQYDKTKLSKGGRIYSRSDKSLKLTPEIKKRFDIEEDKVSPIRLLKAMLGTRTDLLWFGGIGTYIKAEDETHAEVGDKANDSIRLNASEIRAKVIGEGANLGVTQLGRIEFAKLGGRINTDFLDNSGGVDSSDHEVNIKILLTDIMAQSKHKMDIKSRNKLLERMTNEIADHVLRNNYQQAQAISLSELQTSGRLKLQEEFIQELEREKGLDRKIEGLPSTEEIEERLRAGKGLTRPELCVLLSYAKINFTHDLLDCDIPDQPDMQDWLMNYFPDVLQEKYVSEIERHRLRREIIATTMANSLINRMGPTFIKARMKKTGASCDDIARAYIIVREAFQLRPLWDSIEALDNKVPAELQLKAMRSIAQLSKHAVTWFLIRLGRPLDIGTDIKSYGKGIQELQDNFDDLVTAGLKETIKQRVAAGQRDGLPKSLAYKIALLPVLSSACDIVRISLEQKTNLENTARTYFELGERFHFDWLRQQARFLSSDDHWHAEATTGLVDQLYSCQAGLTVSILKDTNGRASKTKSITEKWLEKHDHQVKQLDPLFAELRRAGSVDLPMLIIAEQRLRGLYGG